MMAIAGIIATLTSINTSMLSADARGVHPEPRRHLAARAVAPGALHTPYISILAIGVISCFVAAVGLVDFLRLHFQRGVSVRAVLGEFGDDSAAQAVPDLKRPFKVPLFPLTAYVAARPAFSFIAFTEWKALLFGVGCSLCAASNYYVRRPVGKLLASRAGTGRSARPHPDASSQPAHRRELVHLATILAQASEDTSVCVLTVVPISSDVPQETQERMLARLEPQRQALLNRIADEAQKRNVPLYTKLRGRSRRGRGVLDEVSGNVKLVLMGWPGRLAGEALANNVVNEVLMTARANFAVLLDRA